MSNVTSPQRFSGKFDNFYDGHFEPDITSQMKVPKRIRVSGENDDEPTVNWARYNGNMEKIPMKVPDRILVAGGWGEQHIGTRGVPREVELEQQIMPQPDPALFRVQTPPRSITLDSYTYPSVGDQSPAEQDRDSSSTPASSNPTFTSRNPTNYIAQPHEPETPGPNTDLSPSEEVQLLRRQVGRLNRRVMALELDSQQRANREMFLYSLGVAYFIIKTILWLNRN
ncbi:Transport and Golgi organization protein 11 [Armadillidium nasatum]|uniref:Mitochondrial fission factor n=1 Tax=Armadillidium nasatum TaxID=96803 RepID=A0A5N5T8X0_9CRUS|nr:Transport and Golgi organization protein 11 [Armadillidium nasatum]